MKPFVTGAILLVASIFGSLWFPAPVGAGIAEEKIATPTVQLTVVADTGSVEEYVLPYPGILPDHPLFFLKQLRDQMLDYLIVDPVKKVEFYILQADKRLNMAIFLYDRNLTADFIRTLEEANAYLYRAAERTEELGTSSPGQHDALITRMGNSLEKHRYELERFSEKAPEDVQPELLRERAVIDAITTSVDSLR